MYRYIDYRKIFEAEGVENEPTNSQPQENQQESDKLSFKNSQIVLTLSNEDLDELADLSEIGTDKTPFIRPAQLVDKKDPNKVISDIMVAILVAESDEKTAKFPELATVEKDTQVIRLYPKQLAGLDTLDQGSNLTMPVQIISNDPKSVLNFTITQVGTETPETEPEQTEPEAEPEIVVPTPETEPEQTEPTAEEEYGEPEEELSQEQLDAIETGTLIGANPRNESAVKSFDAFVSEGKKQWIKDIKMKKGALKKELGKDEITNADIAAEIKKLTKKDKDKSKEGLQLNKKDAKTYKRLNLAKNLMKASGETNESKKTTISQLMGPDFYLSKKSESDWDELDFDLFNRIAKMASETGKVPSQYKPKKIHESKKEQIKQTKMQLIKIHEVIEKMIKQTAAKNNKKSNG